MKIQPKGKIFMAGAGRVEQEEEGDASFTQET